MCCMVCTDWIKGSLTDKEAIRNLQEMFVSANEEERAHLEEVTEKVASDMVEKMWREKCSLD